MNPPSPLYWADLHNHNEIGYGAGTLDRSYRLAEETLDAYALSVHGHWPDPPDGDRAVVDHHLAAFGRVEKAFPDVMRTANERDRPGKFACFIAYEWHSIRWGDHVVLFPGPAAELNRAADLRELQAFARRQGALLIPHHVGYRPGWRGLDWKSVDFSLSPVVEIFSEHGGSFERDDLWPMTAHSMGGLTQSQTILAQLARGAHFGFTAGTDTHSGYPGSYGEGLTGIYAPSLSRAAVFEALRGRRTVAATGDRIGLWADSAGALPGDILPAGTPRRFGFSVQPLAPLDYVEVIKNGVRAALWAGARPPVAKVSSSDPHLIRLEWGWGRLAEADETEWVIRIRLEGGEIRRTVPCLGGGSPAVGKANSVRRISDRELAIDSFTSRRNPLPTNGVVIEVAGAADTVITGSVQATVEGRPAGCSLRASLAELKSDDVWGSILPRFSSPKIRLGRARARSELDFEGSFQDSQPGTHDTYVFKARQANGHTVWASPYLFTSKSDPKPG